MIIQWFRAQSRFVGGIGQARTARKVYIFCYCLGGRIQADGNFFNGVVIFIFILFVNVFLLLKRRCGQLHTF